MEMKYQFEVLTDTNGRKTITKHSYSFSSM